jgi:hypothetical protein
VLESDEDELVSDDELPQAVIDATIAVDSNTANTRFFISLTSPCENNKSIINIIYRCPYKQYK